MTKKVTIKDIAKELNTNYSTVSRALNNSSRISEETKKSVREKAKLMGYQPNSFAQQLKKGSSNTIGLVVPRINRVFFSNVINGVEIIAKQNGFNVIICQSNENLQEETNSIQTLLNNNVAGIIMSLSRESKDNSSFHDILNKKVPFVMFDRTLTEAHSNQVINNNFKGAYDVTKHLIEQGYQKISHFTGPLYVNVYAERLKGYQHALDEYNIPYDKNLVIIDALTKQKGYAAVEKLLKDNIQFDAIFAAGDYTALGAMTCLQEKNIKIPEDVGVAGFANEPFTELIGLTSVEQFSTEIGKTAATLLFEDIQEKSLSRDKNIEINPQLITRKSTNKKI
jgi:LacI family transcriptional regulator